MIKLITGHTVGSQLATFETSPFVKFGSFQQGINYSTGSKLVMLPGWSEYILPYIPKLTQKKGNTPGKKESSGHTKKMEYGKMFYTKADTIQTK